MYLPRTGNFGGNIGMNLNGWSYKMSSSGNYQGILGREDRVGRRADPFS
jgi:hypothetical protein